MTKIFKSVFCCFLVFFVSPLSLCADSSIDGYQNAKWGMTKQEAMDAFGGRAFKEQGDSVSFSDTLAGESVNVTLGFLDGELASAKVEVPAASGFFTTIPQAFFNFENFMTGQYGEPFQKTRVVLEDTNPGKDAVAIQSGRGEYVDAWTSSSGDIRLELKNHAPSIHIRMELYIFYTAKGSLSNTGGGVEAGQSAQFSDAASNPITDAPVNDQGDQ